MHAIIWRSRHLSAGLCCYSRPPTLCPQVLPNTLLQLPYFTFSFLNLSISLLDLLLQLINSLLQLLLEFPRLQITYLKFCSSFPPLFGEIGHKATLSVQDDCLKLLVQLLCAALVELLGSAGL